ncbi:MAG: class I SAM-dependent methyltransferase [Minisyncoccota bacterium]
MQPIWTTRIYTNRGFIRENILDGIRALDIGSGNRKLPGAIGIDVLKLPNVDVVHNLGHFPWPFQDGSFDLILANHFLEHSEDVLKTLEEVHRILAPGGRLVIQVPYFRSVDAVTDPTHRHFFTSATLDYVIEGTGLARYSYTPFLFKKIGFWYAWPQLSKNPFARLFKSFITAHRHFYDQYLSLVLPVACLTWELEKPVQP